MNWFKSLSIDIKIALIGAVGIIGLLLNIGLGYWLAAKNGVRLTNIREVNFPVLERTNANVARMVRIKDLLGTAVYTEDEDLVKETIDVLAKKMQKAFDEIIEIEPARTPAIEELQQSFKKYYEIARNVTLGLINDEIPESRKREASLKMINAMNDFEKKMHNYRKTEYSSFIGSIDGTVKAFKEGNRLSLLMGILLIAIMIAAVTAVGRLINSNISRVANSLGEIASGEGDLTKRLSTPSKDVIGLLVNNFNTFMKKLHNIIADIAGSTDHLSTVAKEMSSVSKKSYKSAQNQQVKTEEVAIAMNEITESINEVAKNAETAAKAAENANKEARSGSQVVENTIGVINSLADEVEGASEVIKQLKTESENIGKVLGVIQNISEQTNLLALNAAIEAARAGEHGRGFAVVADEVRILAERTQDSTREISAVIEILQSGANQAVEVMDRGREQASLSVKEAVKAGESLDIITEAVNTITEMNRQIAKSAKEQEQVVNEINQNIKTIKDISEQTSSGAQKTASAGEKMEQLACHLKGLVGRFKV